MDLGPEAWTEARKTLQNILTVGQSPLEENSELQKQ